jgi:hypothetical protein
MLGGFQLDNGGGERLAGIFPFSSRRHRVSQTDFRDSPSPVSGDGHKLIAVGNGNCR